MEWRKRIEKELFRTVYWESGNKKKRERKQCTHKQRYSIDIYLGTFQTICGTINRIFRNKVCRDPKVKFYKVRVFPILSYRCGIICDNQETKM